MMLNTVYIHEEPSIEKEYRFVARWSGFCMRLPPVWEGVISKSARRTTALYHSPKELDILDVKSKKIFKPVSKNKFSYATIFPITFILNYTAVVFP